MEPFLLPTRVIIRVCATEAANVSIAGRPNEYSAKVGSLASKGSGDWPAECRRLRRMRLNSDWNGYSPEFGSHPSFDTLAAPGWRDGMSCLAVALAVNGLAGGAEHRRLARQVAEAVYVDLGFAPRRLRAAGLP